MKTGLVLEGGGQRGIYTVGVLDCFADHGVEFDYCVGVSAGAANAVSYLSHQRGRNIRINAGYARDRRYLSLYNLVKNKSLFGMDFIFDELPNHLDPFDYEAFFNCPTQMEAGGTNLETAQEEFFDKDSMREHYSDVLKASASIPLFSPKVMIDGKPYYDGGTADPIPFERALEQGCDRLVAVLTRDRKYVERRTRGWLIYSKIFKAYQPMVHLLDTRHHIYNEERRRLFELEKEGRAIVIAPSRSLEITTFESRKEKLLKTWELGYVDAARQLERIRGLKRSSSPAVK